MSIIVTELATGKTWDYSRYSIDQAKDFICAVDAGDWSKPQYHLHVDARRVPQYQVRQRMEHVWGLARL